MDICNIALYTIATLTAIHFTGHVASRLVQAWKATAPKPTVPPAIQQQVEELFDEPEPDPTTEPVELGISMEYTPLQISTSPIAITTPIGTAKRYAAKASSQVAKLTVPISPDYSGLKVSELRQICQERGIQYRKQKQGKRQYMTKAEMLQALSAA